MIDLKDKSVLVIGGLGGIGVEIVKSLLANKAQKIAIFDIAEEPRLEVKDLVKDIKFLYQKAPVDQRDVLKASMEKVVHEFGGIDILINSAGICNEQDPEKVISVNYGGVVNSSLIGIDLMRRDHGGNGGIIMNIASLSALRPYFFFPIYAGTKCAVLGFTRSLVNEEFHKRTDIVFISICPGVTSTPMLGTFLEKFTFPEMTEYIAQLAQGSNLQPPSFVGETMVTALEEAENGAVWVCNDSKIEKVVVPDFPY